MPLTLVTGPANAEKAGLVLGAYRAALDRAPLLVVPTVADVERYRRELAAAGAVFGVEVLRFGVADARDRAAGRRSAGARSARWRASASRRRGRARPGSSRLAALGGDARLPARPARASSTSSRSSGSTPGRWYAALRAWAAEREPAQAAYAEELARAVRRLPRRPRAARAPRRAGCTTGRRSTPAPRARRAGAATPVFLYGFDDLTPLQRDAVETLAVHAGADVTLSLTYEPGRAAFAGRGATFQELLALGAEHVALPTRAPSTTRRSALHDLERGLFETPAPSPAIPAAASLLLEGGGERAELELVAAHVAQLIRDEGLAPEEIAVVLRDPRRPRAADRARSSRRRGADRAVANGRRRPHRARPRAGRAAALRAARRHAPTTCSPGCARRASSRARRSPTASRPRRARAGRATAAAGAGAVGGRPPGLRRCHELDRVADAHARGSEALCERVAAECVGAVRRAAPGPRRRC